MNPDTLPSEYAEALKPLLLCNPPDHALEQLVVREAPNAADVEVVEQAIQNLGISGASPVAAGLWLYIDDLERSHTVSQSIPDATGSFWHGIMHRREGDFGNSHYWFHRAGAHPAMKTIEGYDPHAFIDAVAAGKAGDMDALADLQRREFWALFRWCAQNP